MRVHPVHKPYPVGLFVAFDVPATVQEGDQLLLPNGLHVEITSLTDGRAAHFAHDERMARVRGVGQDLPAIGVVLCLQKSKSDDA